MKGYLKDPAEGGDTVQFCTTENYEPLGIKRTVVINRRTGDGVEVGQIVHNDKNIPMGMVASKGGKEYKNRNVAADALANMLRWIFF